MKLPALPLILALVTPLTFASPKLEGGYDAFDRGDVDSAVQIWRELAEQGNATAQLNLGQLYRLGEGVQQNDVEAVKWYILAARNGSEIATYTLMLMEQEGRASKEDVAATLPLEQGTPEDPLATMASSPALVTAPASTPTPVPAPATERQQHDQDWLTAPAANTYLIQLLTSANEASLAQYASTRLEGVMPNATIIATSRGGKTEFLLLLGPYQTQSHANQAVNDLPENVQQGMPWAGGQPWVRTTASVQRVRIQKEAATQ